ncbi:Elicitin [Phytophthora palmivora]|uniref:Elicitin n=1 Tax=Phytophthora palmivora TaxID=4796 RepID=A0A2P4X163_9STRA|nr:Elicitin [Phytophthora palmivora]
MKAVMSSLLLTATAIAHAANCDVTALIEISETTDAAECKDVSNFVVPVESTEDTILFNLELFCENVACQRVLTSLTAINECMIVDMKLHRTIIDPIDAVCSTTRALRVADGSHVHSPSMDMGSATTEIEDSHDATHSSLAEDSHDATSTSSEVYDSHDTSSTPVDAGDDDDDSNDTGSSKSTTSSTAGSKAISNSTSSTPAPNASGTSSAAAVTFAAGSVFLAAAAAFL